MSDKKNILVVNDERAVRQILGNMLKDRGYNVFMAEDGYKAIEKVKDGKIWDRERIGKENPRIFSAWCTKMPILIVVLIAEIE